MLNLKYQKTKTLTVKQNGRSSDVVSPNFIMGCNAGCSNTYCYTRRFGRKYIYVNTNLDEILSKLTDYANTCIIPKIPNQTDDKYYTVDICCDTDLNYHWKNYDWDKVFNYFLNQNVLKATFATKFVNYNLLKYGSQKLRIRFSLMPQNISDILEPKTSKIEQRIKAIDKFIDAGWDVHINFSPILYYKNWISDYKQLFTLIDSLVENKNKVSCECIFLTHNEFLHNLNLQNNFIESENLLWNPNIQENKKSQYGGNNLRYKHVFKKLLIDEFRKIHSEIIPWCKIRYIF